MVTPYLPSLGECRRWWKLRLAGRGAEEAWREAVAIPGRADAAARRHALRGLTRTLVAGANGQPPVGLTVPLIGGASTVKRGDTASWRISMHGDWTRQHCGALLTAYGATPYYPHFMPALDEVYSGLREGDRFAAFTRALFEVVESIGALGSPEMWAEVTSDPRLMKICGEKSEGMHTSLSILDVIFKRGPELPLILTASGDSPEPLCD